MNIGTFSKYTCSPFSGRCIEIAVCLVDGILFTRPHEDCLIKIFWLLWLHIYEEHTNKHNNINTTFFHDALYCPICSTTQCYYVKSKEDLPWCILTHRERLETATGMGGRRKRVAKQDNLFFQIRILHCVTAHDVSMWNMRLLSCLDALDFRKSWFWFALSLKRSPKQQQNTFYILRVGISLKFHFYCLSEHLNTCKISFSRQPTLSCIDGWSYWSSPYFNRAAPFETLKRFSTFLSRPICCVSCNLKDCSK